jgi:hypothetical protein
MKIKIWLNTEIIQRQVIVENQVFSDSLRSEQCDIWLYFEQLGLM